MYQNIRGLRALEPPLWGPSSRGGGGDDRVFTVFGKNYYFFCVEKVSSSM